MRAFIAIEIPAKVKKQIGAFQKGLTAALPAAKITKPENLHLTLKFLGEISPSQAENIRKIITEAARLTPPFPLKIKNAGAFPNYRRPRIIYLEADDSAGRIGRLAGRLHKAKAENTDPDNRTPSFKAHITIGRLKSPGCGELEEILEELKKKNPVRNLEFEAASVGLFQSILCPEGPMHLLLERYALGK